MLNRRQRMEGSIAWMARNPVAANLLMFGLIICGVLMAVFSLRKEVYPQVEMDMVSVTIPYPGASPEEVEKGILRSVEELVRPVDGVREVSGVAYEGGGSVTAQLDHGADKNKVLSDIKNQIDRITTFPKNIERPIVRSPTFRAEAIWLVLYGDVDPLILRTLSERTREQLLELDEISYVTVSGQPGVEIAIEVPQLTLRKHGLTLRQIAQQVGQTAQEIPAGGVKTKGGEILLRTAERRNIGEEFKDIPIIRSDQGSSIKLGDIAEISDGMMESDMSVSYNGQRVVWLRVYSLGDQSPPDVARATKDYVKSIEGTLPPGVEVTTCLDRAADYSVILDLLTGNALLGLLLVLLILGLFLDLRIAFWVTLGIPVAFLGAFLFLPAIGVSLNIISMFAFIVVLGMVVDDAIVVGENIYRLKREGVPPMEAAVRGAREVAMPVFFSVATTIAAFSPILFMPGAMRGIVYSIPTVVIIVLCLSLVESFFILPAHLAHKKQNGTKIKIGFIAGVLAALYWIFIPLVLVFKFFERAQVRVSTVLERFINTVYATFIERAIRRRWITLAIWVALLTASFGLLAGGHVKTVFSPDEDPGWIVVEANLPFGVPVEETVKLEDRFLDSLDRVFERNSKGIKRGVLSWVASDGSHSLFIWCFLSPASQRNISATEFADQWREEVGEFPGVQSVRFDSSMAFNAPAIGVQLSHSDGDTLEAAVNELAEYLKGYKGVKDVQDGIREGKAQYSFKLTQEGIAAGFTTADVAGQLRNAFYGYEALRQQRGRDEIRVYVRLPRSERSSQKSIEDLILRTPSGAEMPLGKVAKSELGRSYSTINRLDGKRIVEVNADVEAESVNPDQIYAALMSDYIPGLIEKYPGLSQGLGGMQKFQGEFMSFLALAYTFALFGMFGLIAIPLRSYLQPVFVVMVAIPFGFFGALLGHLILGMDLSSYSWIGVAALSGVVVNDSIVFVDAANRFRRSGLSAAEAAKQAAVQRFRPIMLTSLTTFGGLAPMIFETSVQAIMLVPMAVSLGFGVLMSTFVILTLVPSMFVIVDGARKAPQS